MDLFIDVLASTSDDNISILQQNTVSLSPTFLRQDVTMTHLRLALDNLHITDADDLHGLCIKPDDNHKDCRPKRKRKESSRYKRKRTATFLYLWVSTHDSNVLPSDAVNWRPSLVTSLVQSHLNVLCPLRPWSTYFFGFSG